jgi:hypothetical protein
MRSDEEQEMEATRHLRFIASRFGARAAPEKDSPLKIVGLHADLPSHTLAMTVLRNVSRHSSGVCKLHSDWWSFDMLQAASEREAAARAAAEADMIWCAAPACEALPEAVTTWRDSWLACRNESECALVALLRCPAGYVIERSPSRAYLCRLARATGLELFVQRFECDCRASVEARSQPSMRSDWFPIESRPERGHIRWGINE